MFRSYPSRVLGPQTKLQLCPGLDAAHVLRRLELESFRAGTTILTKPEAVEQIVDLLAREAEPADPRRDHDPAASHASRFADAQRRHPRKMRRAHLCGFCRDGVDRQYRC